MLDQYHMLAWTTTMIDMTRTVCESARFAMAIGQYRTKLGR
jgi:hypothetical protein